MYQGDFLPSCYDDWIVPYREQLWQQASAGFDQLITLLTTEGNAPSAIRYAQQLQRMDPLHEPTYCHLMRLHAQQGDRASALRVFTKWEPQIVVDDVRADPDLMRGRVDLTISYHPRDSHETRSLVYPFYLLPNS